jgi:FCD domain
LEHTNVEPASSVVVALVAGFGVDQDVAQQRGDHQRLLEAIRDGDSARAVRLAQDHLAARRNTLAVGSDKTIEAKLISSSNHQESAR